MSNRCIGKRFVGAAIAASCIMADVAGATDSLDVCVENGGYCSERMPLPMGSTCGPEFYFIHGRIAFGPLRNTGPVTIAVWTRAADLPLYVEIAPVGTGAPDSLCATHYDGMVALIAQSASQCDGVWESIGPLSLDARVLPNAWYFLMIEGFLGTPTPIGTPRRSAALRCVRVVPHGRSPIVAAPWQRVKAMYR